MGKTPSSTYRIQLHSKFGFEDAAAIADYLSSLGITHFYASPYLQSATGSTHGYDLADFRVVNEELGGSLEHECFCQRLAECKLGQILDIVPNHMSLAQNNRYWLDVLENGEKSLYAEYFDIDWQAGEQSYGRKILLPILENQYGLVLASGAIQISREGAQFYVAINDTRLPIAPSSIDVILRPAAQVLRSEELAFLADGFEQLAGLQLNEESSGSFLRNRKTLLSLLDRFLDTNPNLVGAIDNAVDALNSDNDELHAFLERQNYRLAYWRAADQDLGYRRFFDVNSLIGVQVEREQVFFDTHGLILQWLNSGVLDGVRVDHIDGLRDPQKYLDRLRTAAPNAWIVVEKILARSEVLPETWPVQGTTGYDFLNVVSGLLISPSGLSVLNDVYSEFIGSVTDYPKLVHDKKIAVTAEGLGSDINRITSIFLEICKNDRNHRDFTRAEIRHALREVASCFQVYRSYVYPDRGEILEQDAAVIQIAADVAAQYRPDLDRGIFDFIVDVLLLRHKGLLESDFVLRFQQLTSPVMAKGLEDTALYCFNRLICMNEVGSNLANPITSIDDFHRFNLAAQSSHPDGMVTLTTHDTKRGEDVRARLAVLSEMPQHFRSALSHWFASNSVYRLNNIPDRNTEYLYYQTLVGAWPICIERAQAYMEKATREAKEQTSWTQNNVEFEQGLREFVRQTLSDTEFCKDVEAFVELVNAAGRINSLTQTLLKYTVPGVPDLYQGSELWDHRLVDPDNRSAVDFDQRRQLLRELKSITAERALERMDEGLPKLFVIHCALQVRREFAQCFDSDGIYAPILATGEGSDNVVAFLRASRVATVVPRFRRSCTDGWDDTSIILPGGNWTNVFTGDAISGGSVLVGELLNRFPVALLVRKD